MNSARTLKGEDLNSTIHNIPSWLWVLGAILAVSLIGGQCRRSTKQATKDAVQKVLLREYGDAIQDYRSDPVRFRARVQESVRQGTITQQEADEAIEMVRKMSQTLP